MKARRQADKKELRDILAVLEEETPWNHIQYDAILPQELRFIATKKWRYKYLLPTEMMD